MKRNLNNPSARILMRGETSDHSHIVTGECEILDQKEKVIIVAGKNCAIKHLIESAFLEGKEVWTGEHLDIPLPEGETFEMVPQVEFNPFEQAIRQVRD